MRSGSMRHGAIAALAGIVTLAGNSAASAEAFNGFGMYRNGSVDSIEQLLILPEGSFCYAVTAGSLDLLAAGRWVAKGDAIVLREVRPVSPPIVVIWQASTRAQDRGKILFEFSGRTFGAEGDFLFGTAEDDQLPKDMRPLFADDANGFAPFYEEARPLGAKTFALAYRPQDLPSDGPYTIVQYRLPAVPAGSGLHLRLYYDRDATRPSIDLTATMKDGAIMIDDRSFGKPGPITDGSRATCVDALKKAESGEAPISNGVNRLTAERTSQMDFHVAASAKPLFKTSYDGAKAD
ncbi:hypothetical protein ACSBM8_09470 [Sphingomonas sp. ASY06-1R]|uniref:hypothetical protein n=1 Tax=Sphingomonas sp. ASY06-1R TaxID=3445771 RepID=UPI003FA2FF51